MDTSLARPIWENLFTLPVLPYVNGEVATV
jgi:hypothetical protein